MLEGRSDLTHTCNLELVQLNEYDASESVLTSKEFTLSQLDSSRPGQLQFKINLNELPAAQNGMPASVQFENVQICK